ncbi:MAG: thioesterase family protein [Chitinophagaceae bacterium]|nr:thioesterase family protein [Chitinophagaceae bacterium]
MNRIKISLPKEFFFQTQMSIRITDLNYGGHVGNDNFLSLIQEARQQFLKQFGYGELNFAGYGLIIADVAIEYKHELNYGDRINIAVQAADFDKLGFDLFYLIEIIREEGNILAGKAKTGMICYDYATKKKISIPEIALQKLVNG